eukprot:COSAG01_NODE_6659_length_3559_cov_49.560694_4_plen_57_part_00
MLVKWRGLGTEQQTWEPRHAIAKLAPDELLAIERLLDRAAGSQLCVSLSLFIYYLE